MGNSFFFFFFSRLFRFHFLSVFFFSKTMNLAINTAFFSVDRHGDGWLRIETDGEWQFNRGERLRDRIDSDTLVLKTEEGARVLEPRFPDDLRAGRVLWLHSRAYILASQAMTPRRSLSATRRHHHPHRINRRRGLGNGGTNIPLPGNGASAGGFFADAEFAGASNQTASALELSHSATLIRESRVFGSLHRSLTRSEARAALSDLHKEMARVERQSSAIQTKFVGVSTAKVRGNLEFVAQAEPHDSIDMPLGSPRYIHDDAASATAAASAAATSAAAHAAAAAVVAAPSTTAAASTAAPGSGELSHRGDRPSLTLRTSGRSKRVTRNDSDYLERMLLDSVDGEVPSRLPSDNIAASDSTTTADNAGAATNSKPIVPPLNTKDKSSPLLRLRRFLSPRSKSPESDEKRAAAAAALRNESSSPKDMLRSTSSGSTDREEKVATRRRSRSRNSTHRRRSPSPRVSNAATFDDFRTPRDELISPRSPRSPRKRASPREAGAAAGRTSRSKSRSRSRSRSKSRGGSGEPRARRKRVGTTEETSRRPATRLSLSASARRRADAINQPLSAVPVEEFKIAVMSRDGPTITYDAIPTAAYSDLIVAVVSFARRERVAMADGCEVCVVDADDGRLLGSILETTLDDKAPFLFQRELNKSGVKYEYVFAPPHTLPRSDKPSPAPFIPRRPEPLHEPSSSLRAEESASLPPVPDGGSARDDEQLPPTPHQQHRQPPQDAAIAVSSQSRLAVLLEDDNDSAQPLPPVPGDSGRSVDAPQSARGIALGSVKRLSGIFEAKSISSSSSLTNKQKRLSASSSGTASPATSPKRVILGTGTGGGKQPAGLSGTPATAPSLPMSPTPPVRPPEDDSGAPPPLPTSDPDLLLMTPGRAPPAPTAVLTDDDVGPAPPEPPLTARTMAHGGIVVEEKPKPRKKRSKSRPRSGRGVSPAPAPAATTSATTAAATAAAAAAAVAASTAPPPSSQAEPKPALKLATDAEQEEQRMRQAGVGAVFAAFKDDQKTLPSMPEVLKLLVDNNHDANAVIALLKRRDAKASSEAPPNWDVVEPVREARTFEDFAESMADAASTENAQGRVKRLSLIFLRQSSNNSSSGPSSAKRN